MALSFTKIKETCIYVQDLEETKAFYHDQLGLPVVSHVEGRHIFFRAGVSMLLCFIAEATEQDEHLPPHYGSGQLHFAFETEVANYEEWKAKIQEIGLQVEKEVFWRDNLKSFYFRDPDNHSVEIVMRGIWGDE